MAKRIQEVFIMRCRAKGYSYRTVRTYWHWIRRYLIHHKMTHPAHLDEYDVESFLTHLATKRKVSVSTQNIAFNALRFLYLDVLGKTFSNVQAVRSKKPVKIPEVFTKAEATAVISQLKTPYSIMAMLMYGAGLRLSEVYRLRVKDVTAQKRQIIIRRSKGGIDRITLFPQKLHPLMSEHLEKVYNIHQRDLSNDAGRVFMPEALARKYPYEQKSFHWQYVFPSVKLIRCNDSGHLLRHHIHETAIQRNIRNAIRQAQIPKKASSHTFRHTFATELIRAGVDITNVQKLLGHSDVRTTQIYLHVAGGITNVVKSPLDD